MKRNKPEIRMLLLGLAIVSPCVIGGLLDHVVGNREPVLTITGGFVSICELGSRAFERVVSFATRAIWPCCPDKLTDVMHAA